MLPTGIDFAMQSKVDLQQQIITWGAQFEEALLMTLEIPDGYILKKQAKESYRWFLGCPILSTESGLTWILRKPQTQHERDNGIDHLKDINRIEVLVRIFWPEIEYFDGALKKTMRKNSGDQFSAYLQIMKGSAYAFRGVLLNNQRVDQFLNDSNLVELSSRCAEVSNRFSTIEYNHLA